MKEQEVPKSRIIISIITVLIVVIAVGGFTYAYFEPQLNVPDGPAQGDIVSGNLNIKFETSEYILNTAAMLIKDSEKAEKAEKTIFTVKHDTNSDVEARYDVFLSDINITSGFKSADFKWELLRGGSVVASGNMASIGAATELKLNSSYISLPVTTTHNYELRMWLSETDADQLSLLNGNFSAKVKVVAINAPAA